MVYAVLRFSNLDVDRFFFVHDCLLHPGPRLKAWSRFSGIKEGLTRRGVRREQGVR
jgi:hypothetical protein